MPFLERPQLKSVVAALLASASPGFAEPDLATKSAMSFMITGSETRLRDATRGVSWSDCQVAYGGEGVGSVVYESIDFNLVDWGSLEYTRIEALNQDVARLTGKPGVVNIEMVIPDGVSQEEIDRGMEMWNTMLGVRGMKLGQGDTMVFAVRPNRQEAFDRAVETVKAQCPGLEDNAQ